MKYVVLGAILLLLACIITMFICAMAWTITDNPWWLTGPGGKIISTAGLIGILLISLLLIGFVTVLLLGAAP